MADDDKKNATPYFAKSELSSNVLTTSNILENPFEPKAQKHSILNQEGIVSERMNHPDQSKFTLDDTQKNVDFDFTLSAKEDLAQKLMQTMTEERNMWEQLRLNPLREHRVAESVQETRYKVAKEVRKALEEIEAKKLATTPPEAPKAASANPLRSNMNTVAAVIPTLATEAKKLEPSRPLHNLPASAEEFLKNAPAKADKPQKTEVAKKAVPNTPPVKEAAKQPAVAAIVDSPAKQAAQPAVSIKGPVKDLVLSVKEILAVKGYTGKPANSLVNENEYIGEGSKPVKVPTLKIYGLSPELLERIEKAERITIKNEKGQVIPSRIESEHLLYVDTHPDKFVQPTKEQMLAASPDYKPAPAKTFVAQQQNIAAQAGTFATPIQGPRQGTTVIIHGLPGSNPGSTYNLNTLPPVQPPQTEEQIATFKATEADLRSGKVQIRAVKVKTNPPGTDVDSLMGTERIEWKTPGGWQQQAWGDVVVLKVQGKDSKVTEVRGADNIGAYLTQLAAKKTVVPKQEVASAPAKPAVQTPNVADQFLQYARDEGHKRALAQSGVNHVIEYAVQINLDDLRKDPKKVLNSIITAPDVKGTRIAPDGVMINDPSTGGFAYMTREGAVAKLEEMLNVPTGERKAAQVRADIHPKMPAALNLEGKPQDHAHGVTIAVALQQQLETLGHKHLNGPNTRFGYIAKRPLDVQLEQIAYNPQSVVDYIKSAPRADGVRISHIIAGGQRIDTIVSPEDVTQLLESEIRKHHTQRVVAPQEPAKVEPVVKAETAKVEPAGKPATAIDALKPILSGAASYMGSTQIFALGQVQMDGINVNLDGQSLDAVYTRLKELGSQEVALQSEGKSYYAKANQLTSLLAAKYNMPVAMGYEGAAPQTPGMQQAQQQYIQ